MRIISIYSIMLVALIVGIPSLPTTVGYVPEVSFLLNGVDETQELHSRELRPKHRTTDSGMDVHTKKIHLLYRKGSYGTKGGKGGYKGYGKGYKGKGKGKGKGYSKGSTGPTYLPSEQPSPMLAPPPPTTQYY